MPEENELYQENLILSAKLREKINKKLSSGGLFTPSEQGATFEQATDNLLEKQNKLENQIIDLRKEIQQHDNESEILRNEINKEISGRGKTLRESVNRMIKQKCRNEKYVPTASQKCLQVVTAPFRWVANKTTTGFALAGFLTTIPTICGAVG
jgi:seryl-tRNA synthetase